jgi:hypothetical protein
MIVSQLKVVYGRIRVHPKISFADAGCFVPHHSYSTISEQITGPLISFIFLALNPSYRDGFDGKQDRIGL